MSSGLHCRICKFLNILNTEMPPKKKQKPSLKLGRGKKPQIAGKSRGTAKKVSYPVPVETLKHKDSRVNIPTEELRGFVADAENEPKKLLYPRDISLDPQLVWKGKDEQDAKPLEVPVIPIYIQEKIHPQALIEDLRRQARKEKPADQADLFGDFNGVSFENMVDFYHHDQHWSNRMILGDSLLVMSSLAEKERLRGKVQMIYIDPPYGIKFGSNWQVSTRKRDVKDRAEDASRQPEQVKAFRDTWQMGIHSYLAYLRDRLLLAHELLTESGCMFIQIGEDNVHLIRSLLDEVYGPENFCAQIVFRKTTGKASALLDNTYDVLLWYAKSRDQLKFRASYWERHKTDDANFRYAELATGERRVLTDGELERIETLPPDWRVFRANPLTSQSASTTTVFEYTLKGAKYKVSKGGWKTNIVGMNRLQKANRLLGIGQSLCFVRFFDDFRYQTHNDIWDDTRQSGFGDPKIYVVQTMTRVVERCILMTTDPGDLVLDPTCGSGTTAYVAEQWGRRWITIDTSRVALALARTRLMAARLPYYLLTDSPQGQKKETEVTGTGVPSEGKTEGDVRKGFVYERVPHVMLKSIANNEEVDTIHARWTEKMEPIRKDLNRQVRKSWDDWEIPREAELGWSDEAKRLHREWWQLLQGRQGEIDASIARHADTELLYDQPYEDGKRIRVAGPFTVESLSPHRVLSTDFERPSSLAEGEKESAGQFERMIIENLKTAGVQNTFKKERLVFDALDPFAGTWLHATGEYTEAGKVRRVAVSIGPEHGTVGPDLVKEAAKEAVQGVGFDLLIVCGFAFDPMVSEEGKHYGKLQVLTARMNPDLAMGQELLKKTGSGNLFMVFGEPDVEVKQKDGKVVVEINGLDVYDPTTGEVRSSSTEDIACWFIDTDYNEESFFVRHAYFTGGGDPYEKLKRALRADVNEDAWSALYSTKSRPFDAPSTGKIAVKVINHYGDEVLRVYDVRPGGA